MTKVLASLTILATMTMIAIGCSSTTTQPEPPAKPAAAPPAPTPASAPATASAPAAKPAPATTRYTVVRGDCLWNISSKVIAYGNPQEWPLIYRANRDKIDDADLIYPGQVLVIEKEPTTAQVQAAIKHARTRGQWKLGSVEASDRVYLASSR